MIKLKIVKKQMTIIDDAECTPGQSRLYSRFGEEVLKYIQKNPDAWQVVFKQLDTAFEIVSIKHNDETDETLVMFKFKG